MYKVKSASHILNTNKYVKYLNTIKVTNKGTLPSSNCRVSGQSTFDGSLTITI